MSLTFIHRKQIEFSETDMAGIVHFSNFFRMMEAAEHACLRSLGFSVHAASADGVIGWPRVKVGCDYLKPLRFEEVVDIELHVAEVRNRSVCYRFVFRRENGGEKVAEGQVVAVCAHVDPTTGVLAAVAIPADLRVELERRQQPHLGA